MPKDYKNINKGKSQPSPLLHNLFSFLTGLTVGLFIAFLVYLNKIQLFDDIKLPAFLKPEETTVVEQEEDSLDKQPEAPAPTFDFYKILPNKEINISEWVADEKQQEIPAETTPQEGIYVLQVGSFRKFDSADRLKAKLLLLGIEPEIQRVVINGEDVRYRVRVGPYKSTNQIEKTRRKLKENDFDFMLLKLKSRQDNAQG